METTQTSTIASKDSRSAWRKTDTMWMLGPERSPHNFPKT